MDTVALQIMECGGGGGGAVVGLRYSSSLVESTSQVCGLIISSLD